MGLTKDIEEAIKARQQKRKKEKGSLPGATPGYQDVLTCKEFNISPLEWERLSGFDRKVLMYQRVMEDHYVNAAAEKQKAAHEKAAQRREFLAKHMPKQR